MPNDTYIKLPDGSYLRIPEGTPPDQLAQVKQHLASKYPDAASHQTGSSPLQLPGGIPDANAQARQRVSNIITRGPESKSQDAFDNVVNPKSAPIDSIHSFAVRKRDEADKANLTAAAQGKPTSVDTRDGYDILERASRIGKGLGPSPENAAIAAGMAIAPAATGTALAAQGLSNVAENAPRAFQGDPEATERMLLGGAEAAGGAAGAKGGTSVLRRSPETRAASFYERATAPSGQGAQAQVESAQTFRRAAPYLAEQQRNTPVKAKQATGDAFGDKKMGVMNLKQNAEAAATNVWESKISPMTEAYAKAPVDGARVQNEIVSTLNPNAYADATKAAAVNDIAAFHGKVSTVGEASAQIKALNNDPQIQAYERALPDKQSEMVGANPQLQAKLQARTSLRDSIVGKTDTTTGQHVPGAIDIYGTPEEASYIREARQDMAALLDVSKQLGTTKVPTEAPLATRLANTARLSISPGFAREYISRPVSTLFDLNNPNRLAAKASQALGESTLTPREAPPIRPTPWAPPGPLYNSPAGPVMPPAPNVFARPALPPTTPTAPARATINYGGGPGPVSGSGDVGAPVVQRPTSPIPVGANLPYGNPIPVEQGAAVPESLPPDLRWPQAPKPGPQVGQLPQAGFPVATPDRMWTGGTPGATQDLWSQTAKESASTLQKPQPSSQVPDTAITMPGRTPAEWGKIEAPTSSPSQSELDDVRQKTGLPLTDEAAAQRIRTRTDLNAPSTPDIPSGALTNPATTAQAPSALPPEVQAVSSQTGYDYLGSSEPFPGMRIHEFKHGPTNRSVTLFDKDLNAATLAQRIADKNAQDFSGTMGANPQ